MQACLCSAVCLFDDSSQMIEPKGLKSSGFDGVHPGKVMRKVWLRLSGTLSVGLLFFSLKISWFGSNLNIPSVLLEV